MRYLVVLLGLFHPSAADAQDADSLGPASAPTISADTTGGSGWSVDTRFRGFHSVMLLWPGLSTLGFSSDLDFVRYSRMRPPLASGLRVGFEQAQFFPLGIWDGADFSFTSVDLLARVSLGGGSAEWTIFAGYSWMFVPKYAGLVLRLSMASERLLSLRPAPRPSYGETPEFSEGMGGIGFIIGWEP